MIKKMKWLQTALSALLVWSFCLNAVPSVKAQDIVSSDDISSGSSVFVFRKSQKAAQSKYASNTSKTKRTNEQKAKSRQTVREQVAKVTPKRPKVTVTPTPVPSPGKTPRPTPTPDNTASRERASNALAGSAEIYLERGDLDRAISYFRESIKLNPQNESAKLGLSETLTRKADGVFDREGMDGAEAAIALYTEALSFDQNNAAAYAALGGIYEELEDNERTFENYDRALKLNPNLTELYAPLGVAYYQKGEIAKADELLTKAVAMRAEDDQTQLLLGLIRYKQVRNEEAIAALKRSLALKESAEAHYYLGEIYDRLDRDKEALAEYNKAVALNPRYTDAWFDLGVINYNRGRYQEAINAFEQTIRLKNDNYEAHEYLADVYRQLAADSTNFEVKKQNYSKAESSYSLAVTLAERNPKAQTDKLALADLYSKYGFILGRLEKWTAAITNLNKAVALNPDSIDYTNLGWAYYNAAQVDLFEKQQAEKASNPTLAQQKDANARVKLQQAKSSLEKSNAMNPNFVGTLINLGVTLNDLGDFKNAVDILRKCVQLRPNWFPALNELGAAYKGAGNLAEAAKTFNKAADEVEKLFKNAKSEKDKLIYARSLSTGLYNLAVTESERGNSKDARKAQDRLRKIDPNRAEALNLVFNNPTINNKIQTNNPLNKIPRF